MALATLPWLPPWLAIRDKIIFTLLGFCAYLAAMLWTGSYLLTIDWLRAWQQHSAFTPKNWLRYFDGGLYHSFILLARKS